MESLTGEVEAPVKPPRSLGQRTLGGMLWMFVGVVGQLVIQITVLVVLARHVSPTDFGVASAALVVLGLWVIFADLGVGNAIVQRTDLRPDHIRVAFTVSSLLGLIVWLVLIGFASGVAGLFRIPRLTPVLGVIGVVFFVRSLTLGDHLLQRQLDFRRLAIVELIALSLGYGVVSVALAISGAGVWAIVWGHVAMASLRTILLWCVRPHPCLPSLALKPLVELLRFGAPLAVAQLAGLVATQGDNFVVGRWLGPYALGLYGRAYQLMAMPALLFGHVAHKVLFPAMASVQDDKKRLRTAYGTGVAVIAVLTLPLSVTVAITAREFILVVLGSEWLPLHAAFDVLVFCMLFRTSHKISDSLALAAGAVYRRAARQWIYAALVVLGAVIGQRWGLFGLAIGLGIALTINFFLMAQLCLTLIDMSWRRFVSAHGTAVYVSLLVAAAAWPTATVLREAGVPAAVVLVGTLGTAGVVGLAAIRTAPRVPGMGATAELVGNVRAALGSGSARSFFDRVIVGRRHGAADVGAK
jgi:O-antigen/teichoic acid export membrane protein